MSLDMKQLGRGSNPYRETPQAKIGRSTFDRSHTLKTTFDASELIPILVDEVLPGDTFTLKMSGFARIFAPLKAPIMDNIQLETHFFFVPTRLLWDNWEKFNGAQTDPGDSIDFTIPRYAAGILWNDSTPGEILGSYFGIPYNMDSSSNPINTLPFRAYNLIYNEWFRDENLIDSVTVRTTDGSDDIGDWAVLKRAKRHDRFTSALPWTQKGDAVAIPFTNAPIIGIAATDQIPSLTPGTIYDSTLSSPTFSQAYASTEMVFDATAAGGAFPAIFADNSALNVTVNQLRESVAIQRLLEIDARGGTRYVEHIKHHFGVTSPDFRLQRPEFLGGGKSYINVSPIAQTAEGTTNAEVGTLAAVGAGTLSNGHGFGKSFTEHGYVIGLVSARGDITYQQGLDRMWSKSTRYDYFVPALANLGEDAILNRELYISNDANDDAVFGYQERWYEYRTKLSMITGKFRSAVSGTLDFWHLGQNFGSLPTLAQTFIEDATPMSRITAVSSEPDFILDAHFDYRCARPMPVYSIPSLTTMRF